MNRNPSIDILKTIAIFGVVWIHGSTLLGSLSTFNIVVSQMFRFAVPTFIIIWAYFLEKGLQKRTNVWAYYRRRFLYLFSVYFFWSLLYFLLLADWDQLSLKSAISKHWSGYGWSGQFFFIILFQLLLLFPGIRIVFDNALFRKGTIVVGMLLFITFGYFDTFFPEIIWKIGDRFFVYWIPYAFWGIYLAREPQLSFSFWGCLSVLLIPLEFLLLKGTDPMFSQYVSPSVFLASILITGPFLLRRSNDFSAWQKKLSSFIGNNTMTVFVANPIVIIVVSTCIHNITSGFDPTLSLSLTIILPIFSTILVLSSSLLLAEIINRTPLKKIIN